ncbi:MAG: GWxTD domain-containing protein [Bacteroidia bacterium]|nr:GWxTD domain-containing protein [Bacteroidia bacterium]
MPTNNIKYLALLCLLLLASACGINSQLANKDYSALYSLKSNKLEPWFKVYHHASNRSTLYINYNAINLLYAKPLTGENLQSKMQIHYRLFSSGENMVFLDSASFVYMHNKNEQTVRFTDSLLFPCARGNNYLLEIKLRDLNKKEEIEEMIFIEKTDTKNEQNFILKKQGKLLFANSSSTPGDTILLQYCDTSVKKIWQQFFLKDYPLALPPFSIENIATDFKADTQLVVTDQLNTFQLTIPNYGYYLFKIDTLENKGANIKAYGTDFPDLSTYAEMIPPLRYICTRNEFDLLTRSSEPKKALDNFWVDLSGNNERARELIKQFYGRVQQANLYFSSYKSGWKTDRGMIYIVFGVPNFVNRTHNLEIWTYGEQNNYRSINFYFNRNEKSINANDFILDRNPLFKDEWMQAVDVWRQGRVYNPYN